MRLLVQSLVISACVFLSSFAGAQEAAPWDPGTDTFAQAVAAIEKHLGRGFRTEPAATLDLLEQTE